MWQEGGLIVTRTRGIQLIIPALGGGVASFNRISKPLDSLPWKKLLSLFCHWLHLYQAENPSSYLNEWRAPSSGPLTRKDVQIQRQLLVMNAGLKGSDVKFHCAQWFKIKRHNPSCLEENTCRQQTSCVPLFVALLSPTVSPQAYGPCVVCGFCWVTAAVLPTAEIRCCWYTWFVCFTMCIITKHQDCNCLFFVFVILTVSVTVVFYPTDICFGL